MRVLVLTNMFPPHHLGGYELSCRDVLGRWAERGHESLVLTTDYTRPGVPDEPGPAPVRRTLRWYWRDHAFVRPAPWQRLRLEQHNRAELRRAVAEHRPDVVSVWHMGGMSLGLLTEVRRLGLPAVLVVCDEWPDYGRRHDAWMSAFAERPVLGRAVGSVTRLPTALPDLAAADALCFVSDFLRGRLAATTGLLATAGQVVPSGIDERVFPVGAPDRGSWRGRLLCVGRVEPRKGFADAVAALPALPGTMLRVVGPSDGGYEQELRSLAARLDVADRVTFEEVSRAELPRVYGEADALLFTSAWQEPFGLVPLEAMACSLPVVACPTGGASEFLVDGENCLTFTAARELPTAVQRLAADAGLRQTIVGGGRRTAARLTIARYADDLERHHLAASGAA